MTGLTWADHRVFDTAQGALLLAVEQSALYAFEPDAREALARWRSREPILLEAVSEPDRGVLEGFRDAGLLVSAGAARTRAWSEPDPAAVPLGTLVLEVAQACNLQCAYCYAGGGAYGGEPRLLSPGLARRASRFLVEASGEREEVTLVLFGGEPLLNAPALVAAVEEAERAASAAGKRLVMSVTTNGTRFTPELVDFLREHRVNVSVSLDGPPRVHDANRRRADGQGTYAEVLRGLELLRERLGRPPAARVTLTPAQWREVPEVFDHVLGLGFLEVGIAPASPVTRELLPTSADEEALVAGFSALTDRFLEEADRGSILPFSNLLDLLGRLHRGDTKRSPCGAGLGYLAADAGGGLFLCHRLAGEEAFRVGDLDAGIDHARIRARLAAQAAPRREACSACWARGFCAGGCHYENHLRETTLGLPPGGTCAFIRRWLELGIRVYARLCRKPDNPVLAFVGGRR
ncbi:MAG: radical SAM protein [Deltaproteobacteria bacterium]|nr:radical SAM protein [Deltaproteobacteria bacterium]